ncbi:hypothetical protein, partial [Marinomonas polaris]|uniref:hypothetical protein n=1 Tax=Marinomonas polaris TaxID=293552 RepID=UPI003F9795EE
VMVRSALSHIGDLIAVSLTSFVNEHTRPFRLWMTPILLGIIQLENPHEVSVNVLCVAVGYANKPLS